MSMKCLYKCVTKNGHRLQGCIPGNSCLTRNKFDKLNEEQRKELEKLSGYTSFI